MVHPHNLDTRKAIPTVFPAREHLPLTRDWAIHHAELGQTVRLHDNRGLPARARDTSVSALRPLQRCDLSDGARRPHASIVSSRPSRAGRMTSGRARMANPENHIEPAQEPQAKTTT